MIDTLQIINAVSALAVKEIPELKATYIDLKPKNFERPCLLIETATVDPKPAAAWLEQVTAYFTLTLYDTTDDYSHSDTVSLLALQTKLLNLFRCGYLRVGDRALPVKASTGGRNWDRAYVDLQLEYLDSRMEEETLPLMESVETAMHINKNKE